MALKLIQGKQLNTNLTGSFTGSFRGDGSFLTGVVGEWDGTLNGNSSITGSLSQGSYNLAIGHYSHAEGSSTQAIGDYSHAEGASTKTGALTAYYVDSISDGVLRIRGASYGDKTTEFPADSLIIYDDADFDSTYGRTIFTVLSSTFDGDNLITLTDNTVQGSGAIAGNPDYITSWTGDQTLRGDYSHAEGAGNIALGYYSHAEGNGNIVIGETSHVEGVNSKAIGAYSHAEGSGNRAIGNVSHVEGDSTQTLGYGSHAEGASTTTGQYGYYSFNIIDGIIILSSQYGDVTSQFVAGGYILLDDYDYDDNYTIGRFEITNSTYTGGLTRIFLVDTTVTTTDAIIGVYDLFQPTGADKVLGGYGSHAEGTSTNAIGPYSHAEGSTTTALGGFSHTEGRNTQAIGKFSHTEGLITVALGDYQHVQGQYNITSSAQSAFIVGNGTSNSNRSNLIFASGSQVQITGSLIISTSGSFVLPLTASATPQVGSAYWSGSLLFVYNGTRYMSASFL